MKRLSRAYWSLQIRGVMAVEDEINRSDSHGAREQPRPAADALLALLIAARNLGMQTAPTADEPNKVITVHAISDLPSRVFAMVKAIEALDEIDSSELAQVIDGAVTILRLKIALHAVLGWIAARGLTTREVSQMVVEAVNGPINPHGSAVKLNQMRVALLETMGAAAPRGPTPGM